MISHFISHKLTFTDIILLDGTASPGECLLLAEPFCSLYSYDSFTVLTAIWASVQLVWVTFLSLVQLVQISQAITTNEAFSMHKHGAAVAGSVAEEAKPVHRHTGGVLNTCLTLTGIEQMTMLIKDHRLFTGRARAVRAYARPDELEAMQTQDVVGNPFDGGVVRNCLDFWSGGTSGLVTGSANGRGLIAGGTVDYMRLWDIPIGGLDTPRTL